MKRIKRYIQELFTKKLALRVFRSIAGCIEKRILELQILPIRFRLEGFPIRFPLISTALNLTEKTRTDGLLGKTMLSVFLLAVLASCTDVVDVEVQNGPERLVVEASIDWEKGTNGNVQTITLRKSTPFFDTNSVVGATGATVTVTNDNSGVQSTFADQNNGEYRTTNFQPVLGQSYSLRIEYNGEIYTAQETMTPVPGITEVFQAREEGFDEEILEVHLVFTDPETEGDNYLFKFQRQGDLLPDLEYAEDEFVNGNEIDWWYEIEDEDDVSPFAPGDVVDIEMYGISRAYYDYIKILIDQLGGVGLFDTTPVAVKGNVINQTRLDNYAFGYFRLTEVNRTSYTFVDDESSTN